MRPVTKDDAKRLLNIYSQSQSHAMRVGKIDWPNPITLRFIEELIDTQELFCFENDGIVVAAARISRQPADASIWPDSNATSLYLGKIATADVVRGSNYFVARMLPLIYASLGSSTLRLDCLADNSNLKNFYSKSGFIDRGEVTFFSHRQGKEITVTRFERPAKI